MRKSQKLYASGIVVELVAIILSFAHTSTSLNIYLTYLPYSKFLILLAATSIFMSGILCITFGRNAEKSEVWFHKCSIIFSAYERSKAKVA